MVKKTLIFKGKKSVKPRKISELYSSVYLSISFTATKPAPHMSEEISSLFGYILLKCCNLFSPSVTISNDRKNSKEFLATGLKSQLRLNSFSILSARLQHPPLTVQAFTISM